MVIKRKRHASPSSKGLAAGEQLKRSKLAGHNYSAWGWVGTEVTDPSKITQECRLATCGFSKTSGHPFCTNIHVSVAKEASGHFQERKGASGSGELEDDVIVISDDEQPSCSKKLCKSNPNCLNYLGQEKWEDEDDARERFFKASNLGDNPILDTREPDLPVGLKNLGATCYANAFLQVWFRDLAFRDGVYCCQPSQDEENKFEESPIFQLQVTFAALQESTQNVFNPTKLVESLQLRTTEQQDAQEFSKLFMSHLDAEFQKQSIPSLRSLIADQFQGKQVYGTLCENKKCHYRSERVTDFLEIEINFESNSKLEDRIAALLQPETLSGDNQYFCSQCNSLQDAIRYTELRQLPPVLHFSLLRFIYDFNSMERKKSKHAISFPTILDMRSFLGTAATRRMAATSDLEDTSNIYELRGVLLHKGASAYHGHYEAQVFDVKDHAWFQFNDETVTKIVSLGGKQKPNKRVINIENDDDTHMASGTQGRKQRASARKNRRVDDSEDEISDDSSVTSSYLKEPERISSKDAYMLVYCRKEPSTHSSQGSNNIKGDSSAKNLARDPTPPARALQVINVLNATHDEACERFLEREKKIKDCFEDTRRKVMDIYRSWNISSGYEKSVVVSRQALEDWISDGSIKSVMYQAETPDLQDAPLSIRSSNSGSPASVAENDPDIPPATWTEDILCSHNGLDPRRATNMKRISQAAYQRIVTDTGCAFHPTLTPEHVCDVCVRMIFVERLYQIEHPRLVHRFDQLCEVQEESPGYWISKQWLKDWRLVKPKMHIVSEGDPPPDAADFDAHVRCEHGNLSLMTTTRRRISVEACEILTSLYPFWEPVSSDAEPCPVCDALIHISKEDKRELRRMAEDEKAKLKHMHDNALSGHTALLENVPLAVIPSQFVRSWRQWLLRPSETVRPETIDNTLFMCEHDLLVFDPNDPTDMDSTIAVIKRSDWDSLDHLYSGGPLIALENRFEDYSYRFVHDIPVCVHCRQKRKSDYDMTHITIRILGANDSTKPGVASVPNGNKGQPTALSCGPHKVGAVRQSKRLRQVKEQGEKRKLSISRHTTVKDIKVALQDKLHIPTICQRLYYQGEELEDNAATVTSLGILANDVLDLRENEEDKNGMTSDSDDIPAKKKRRDEGGGFGGTLLGGSKAVLSQPPTMTAAQPPVKTDEKSCAACTFSNPLSVTSCTICGGTLFA